jgi:DNA-binding HxlR family transcriptional regulator
MLQAKHQEMLVSSIVLFAVSALLMLGAVIALGVTRSGGIQRAAGLMPEIVVTADLPRLVLDEIVIRAPHPGHLAGAVARLSGIN